MLYKCWLNHSILHLADLKDKLSYHEKTQYATKLQVKIEKLLSSIMIYNRKSGMDRLVLFQL